MSDAAADSSVVRVAAIIVAGGSGERFGAPGGKQLAEVAGAPVLAHTLRAFDQSDVVDRIIVVVHPDRVAEYHSRAIEPFGFATPIEVVPGGDTRQQSVSNGLNRVDAESVVIVHDGARPLVTPEVIEAAVDSLMRTPESDGVIVGHPAFDTLKIVAEGRVRMTPDRSEYWVAQTPQVFRTPAIREAYDSAREAGSSATDDAGLVEARGGVVTLIQGPRVNIKVTVAQDLEMVEAALLHRRKESTDD